MAQIQFVNTDNLHTSRDENVEVHGAGCQHLARMRKHPFFEDNGVEECESAQDFFDEYNSDFYAEADLEFMSDANDNCWPIAFFPCSGLVTKTTVISRMSY